MVREDGRRKDKVEEKGGGAAVEIAIKRDSVVLNEANVDPANIATNHCGNFPNLAQETGEDQWITIMENKRRRKEI